MDLSGNMFREFANEDLAKNPDKFHKYAEFARQLISKEINLEVDQFFLDCLHQPYSGAMEFNHVDAYFLSEVLAEFYNDNIIFSILKTYGYAKKDINIKGNNAILEKTKPIHGEINNYESEFIGGKGYCDGYLKFEGEVIFISHKDNEQIIVKEFDGLLEVGNTDISTTYVHLFVNNGHLARFPYGHEMIGLFVKRNYVNPINKI